MYFFGDFAIPGPEVDTDFRPAPGEHALVNVEGYLVQDAIAPTNAAGVHNQVSAIQSLGWDKIILGFANNHIADRDDGVVNSVAIAQAAPMPSVGAGATLAEATSPLIVEEDGISVAIVAAGWDLIGCIHATERSSGVAPMKAAPLLRQVRQLKAAGHKVVLFLHWGYETERYPHPLHRQMAHDLAEAGADIIVGCHAHCLQGFERHEGVPIFYGTGNFAFQEGHYYGGALRFPAYCSPGLSVRWDVKSGDVTVAEVRYSGADHTLEIGSFTPPEANAKLAELSRFSALDAKSYLAFFRANRVKKALLPIFSGSDESIGYRAKYAWVKARGLLLSAAFKAKARLKRARA
ncbi:CapA family protein [Sphingomicrobium marinum]|uniref:CapA family protein n=1 Tax=Sphingomicrobium marinum TaxID=1227950 RepID=UPI002240BFF0|nr:CapA family protein [Sphingomicrobium marinum]